MMSKIIKIYLLNALAIMGRNNICYIKLYITMQHLFFVYNIYDEYSHNQWSYPYNYCFWYQLKIVTSIFYTYLTQNTILFCIIWWIIARFLSSMSSNIMCIIIVGLIKISNANNDDNSNRIWIVRLSLEMYWNKITVYYDFSSII